MSIKHDKDLVDLYIKRIDAFERTYASMHDRMRSYEKIYKGIHPLMPNSVQSEDLQSDGVYNFKLVYAIIQNFVSALVLSSPDIVLRPTKPESVDTAKTVEKVVNYYWRELEIKNQLKQVVRDALKQPFGVMKLGWEFKRKILDTIQNKEQDIGGQETFQPNELIVKDNPFVTRISPFLLLWDVQARNLQEARWVGEKIVRPIEDLRRDPRYKKALSKQIPHTAHGVQDLIFGGDGVATVEGNPDSYGVIYEIHDKERNRLITIARGLSEPLRNIPYPLKNIEGTHYELMVLEPQEDKVEGISKIALIAPQADALNKVRTFQVNHLKSLNRLYLVSRSSEMSEKDLVTIQRAPDGAAVHVDGSVDDIKLLPTPTIPQDAYAIGDIAKGDMLQTVGQPPAKFGTPVGGRTTATEIQSIGSAEANRTEDARAIVEDFAAKLSKKLIQIIGDKLSDDKVLMIAGEENFIPFNFSKKDLQGEFDYLVLAGSMTKPNKEVRRQQLMNLLNVVGQFPMVNLPEFLKRIFNEFDLTNPEALLLEPQPAPAAPEGGGVQDESLLQQEAPPSEQEILSNVQNAPNLTRGE